MVLLLNYLIEWCRRKATNCPILFTLGYGNEGLLGEASVQKHTEWTLLKMPASYIVIYGLLAGNEAV